MLVKNFKFLAFCFAICFFAACGGDSKETLQTIPKEKLIGIPEECSDKLRLKDSIGYYSCCENLNACWVPKKWHYEGYSIIYKDSLVKKEFYLVSTIVSKKELIESLERVMRINKDKALKHGKLSEDKLAEFKKQLDSVETTKDSLRKIKNAEAEANIKRFKEEFPERTKKFIEAGLDSAYVIWLDSITFAF